MPKLEYFLVSESLSVDQNTNHVSVFGILEELRGELPIAVHRLVAISSWHIAPDERDQDFQATLRIRSPGGDTMPESDAFKVNFTTTRMRHRIFHHVHGLAVSEFGDLVFEILLDGECKATHTITVHAPEEDA